MDKPTVKLLDSDGNAFMIIGTCIKAAKKAGWTKEQISDFQKKAMSGDYDNLLRLCCDHFEIE